MAPVIADDASEERASSRTERLRTGLLGQLFPVPTAPPRAGWSILLFLLASVVALFRLPRAMIDTVWAEDGNVFLQGALDHDGLSTFTRSYNGYLHLYPRLVAELATAVPAEAIGWLFSVAGALVVGLAAWAAWDLGSGLVRSWPVRALVAASVVLVPAGAFEAVDNVANSHWYLDVACFWALLARGRGPVRTTLQVVIVVLATLSDPLSLVLAPIALLRLVAVRTWRDRLIPAVYALALAGQLAVALSQPRDNATPATLHDMAFGYAFRVVSTSVLGLHGTSELAARAGAWGVSALAAVVAVVLAAALVTLPRVRPPLAVAGLASMAFFAVSCFFAAGVRYPPVGDGAGDLYLGSRYTIVPSLLLVSAVALAAQGLLDRFPHRGVRAVVPVALLVPTVLVMTTDYRADTQVRVGVVPWSDQVDDVTDLCRTEPPQEVQTLVVAPGIPWHVDVTCAEVAG